MICGCCWAFWGILTGIRDLAFEIIDWQQGVYYLCVTVKNKKDGFTWDVINIYGPAQQRDRDNFLGELGDMLHQRVYPVIFGGDFNMYRFHHEKSNGILDFKRMEAFNNFVNEHCLQELYRSGGKFTWTNNQVCPIRVVLDRIFVSANWEHKFPLAFVFSLLRVGSDHCPLLVDTRDEDRVINSNFRFEMGWFQNQGFKELLISVWPTRYQKGVLDFWHFLMPFLRRWLRGWSGNMRSLQRKKKKDLEQKLTSLDQRADERDLFESEWKERYELEKELENIYIQEEIW